MLKREASAAPGAIVPSSKKWKEEETQTKRLRRTVEEARLECSKSSSKEARLVFINKLRQLDTKHAKTNKSDCFPIKNITLGGSVRKNLETPDSDSDLYVELRLGPDVKIEKFSGGKAGSNTHYQMTRNGLVVSAESCLKATASMIRHGLESEVHRSKVSAEVTVQGHDYDVLPSVTIEAGHLIPSRRNSSLWSSNHLEDDLSKLRDARKVFADTSNAIIALKILFHQKKWKLTSFVAEQLVIKYVVSRVYFDLSECFNWVLQQIKAQLSTPTPQMKDDYEGLLFYKFYERDDDNNDKKEKKARDRKKIVTGIDELGSWPSN